MSGDIPLIRLSLNLLLTDNTVPEQLEFMKRLNIIIAGQSTLNYHLIAVSSVPYIYIPAFPYKRSDFTGDMAALVKERVNILKQFLSTHRFDKDERIICHLLRRLLRCKRETKNKQGLFKIECKDPHIVEYADIRHDLNIVDPRIIRHRLTDGSYISVYIDPYLVDEHTIMSNLSKRFSEMSYQYNALHLYEHFMTYAWKNCDRKHEIYVNGLTVVNGISNVFAILDTSSALMDYLNAYIAFNLNARDKQFWLKNKEMVQTETLRTLSETRAARSFSLPSRSDPAAYDCNYNLDIFCKWSNDPFDILLITNTPIDIDVKAINAKILSARRTTIKLTAPEVPFIPVESFMDKNSVRVIKESPEKIIDDLFKHNFNSVEGKLYGIDNYMLFPVHYDISFNYNIHGLLYMHRFVKDAKSYDKKILEYIDLPSVYKDSLL